MSKLPPTGVGTRRALAAGALLAAVVFPACDLPSDAGPTYRVEIEPGTLAPFTRLRDTVQLEARVTDEAGDPVDSIAPAWSSTDVAVARVGDAGQLMVEGAGSAFVVATVTGHADSVAVVVDPVVASIQVQPLRHALGPRGVVQLSAVVTDSGGNALDLHRTWTSSDETRAWVDAGGRAFGNALGAVSFTVSAGHRSAVLDTAVTTVAGVGTFMVWSADTTVIAGVLDIPEGTGPHPTMVRVHGAGPNDRRSGLFAASTLVPAGFALLRYDKRGVGQSEGTYAGIGTSDASTALLRRLGDDAAAWAEFLTHHESVDPDRLGLLGVSQGGWINVIAATVSPHVRYTINVVGTTITLGQQIHYQNLTGSTGAGQNNSGLTDQELYEAVKAYDGPMGYDPAPELRALAVPGLWVLGTKDYLVPYWNTKEILDGMVMETGQDYRVHTLPNATHGTRDRDTGQLVPWWDVDGGGFDWLTDRGFYTPQGSARSDARQAG